MKLDEISKLRVGSQFTFEERGLVLVEITAGHFGDYGAELDFCPTDVCGLGLRCWVGNALSTLGWRCFVSTFDGRT